jgi:hypothetical protein
MFQHSVQVKSNQMVILHQRQEGRIDKKRINFRVQSYPHFKRHSATVNKRIAQDAAFYATMLGTAVMS